MSTPRWALIPKAAEMLGYSRVAIEHKIKNGTWSEGRIWRKARDGRIFISLEEVACKQLLAMAPCTEPQTITVQLNRHESIHETVTPLISPVAQARRKKVNLWFIPTSWNSKWANIQRRAKIRPRRPYQTRHTYACWCLVTRGNLAFIAKQMGHKDFTMPVQVYAKWMNDESTSELQHIWAGMQKAA